MEIFESFRWALVLWMLFTQLVGLGTLLFWLMTAGMSVMAFDSGVTPQAILFLVATLAYPLLPIGLGIGAWVAFANQSDMLAFILTSIILLPAVGIFFIFAKS
jgi:hypothetical protein